MKLFTTVKEVLADQRRKAIEAARQFRKQTVGFLYASGTAEGTDASRTHKRAVQRAKRRLTKLEVLRQAAHNPAGSKLRRQFHKAATGERHEKADYQEACDWWKNYFGSIEPKHRRGESKARIESRRAW